MKEILYYIQNTGFSGNCLKWWAVDGKGYTLNLDAAWKVPEDKARAIAADRPQQDIMWPVDEIDAVASRHLNFEALTMEQKTKASGR
jgi:hypothetical protein